MELAYAGLHQLCGPFVSRLEVLPGPQRDALGIAFGLRDGDAPGRFLVCLAVLSLLPEVAEERPLICIVDDAQWLDTASAQALAFVGRRLGAESVGLVFAVRDPFSERYFEGLPELDLAGLDDADAQELLVLAELIEAAVRSGHPERAAGPLAQLAEIAHAADTDWALGTEARAAAMLAEGSTAERLYRKAIERLSRTRGSETLARAHLLYGEWLRRENRRVDAREQLRIAHTMLTDMGMEAFAERARRELLATGETVRKRTVETLGELTPQELQVARLAVRGQTNPEIGAQLFLSPRTVEWHLRKVFAKLGISSRKELRAELHDIGAGVVR
jgi:DNA-binding CsgD family transcriptional regulator